MTPQCTRRKRSAMSLTQYLDGMQSASTAAELEVAIQAASRAKPPFKHPYSGPTWSRICTVRKEAGKRICAAHPNGKFVPRLGPRHLLTVCGETYSVGYGQNSTGVRYCWHYAKEWSHGVLAKHGFSKRAAARIWDTAFDYPHRALSVVADALAGKIPDPRFDRLLPHRVEKWSGPVRVNRRTEAKDREHRPCKCGDGWLWDWGAGWDGSHSFVNWHCDRCPRVYTEYVSNDRLTEIRQRKAASTPTVSA
jgi:hypothetical protein